ncbi:hypothetical protein [Caldimonas tepidiphila]|uniref:hypothetical protein n=1 Tax=Caldimonas tepidiphila TaxID=2315841 RepID=UPI0013004AD1|nr:hypothetical protein [Caldimonas tepidiphila]
MTRGGRAVLVAVLLAGLFAGLHGTVQADAGPPRAADVEAELRVLTVRQVLERHFGCGPVPGAGYRQVAAGGAAWVALAARLLASSDACHREGLQSALGEAMRRAPQRVLPLLGRAPELAVERICLSFIPQELPAAQRLRQLALSRRALERVDDPALAGARGACLDFIGQVEAGAEARR